MMDLTRLESLEAFASVHGYRNLTKLVLFYKQKMTETEYPSADALRLCHGLSVCRLLIDLAIEAPDDVADMCLTSALFRGISLMGLEDSEEVQALQLSDSIQKLNAFTRMIGQGNEKEKEIFYAMVQEDKPALMVTLADRATFLTKLHELPLEESRRHVRETRQYFFSMCVYAIEQYPDLAPKINILRRKIKGLCEVYDILTDRFKAREQELSIEILRVQEENAGLRARIAAMREIQNTDSPA
ncbi:MAG: hypothetical protein Q4B22_04425 [Eubacteriales bacterium]|nr:hypothetical protein [Eubacteriales bacterium]